jgi:hypothetical protein
MSAPAATYTYRVQVERRSGGWVNLADRDTGAIVDGFHRVVDDASEGDLGGIAEQVMERLGGTWRNCRVVFFTGHRRQDEILRDDEVFGMVTQGQRVLIPGPAHPGNAPSAQPAFGSQPRPVGKEPWLEHGLVHGQVVECGACRSEITVRLVQKGVSLIGTPDNMRGTALICGDCGRLLCVDCVLPVVDGPFEPQRPTCDRCGGIVGPLGTPDGQGTSQGISQASYAGRTAAELIDRVVACRRVGRREDQVVREVLNTLRRAYGHPAYPFAASLERLAFGTAGPPLFQESMEPDEVEIVDTILQRLIGHLDDQEARDLRRPRG